MHIPMTINRTQTGSGHIVADGAGTQFAAVGVTMTLKTVGAQSDGQWLVLEYVAPPHFAGPPPHWHKVTTEHFYVLSGTLTVHVGTKRMALQAGGYAFVPPHTVHAFANEGDEPAKFLLTASPAGLEEYFAELGAMIANEPQWPPRDMGKVVALMARYDTFAPPVA